MPIYSQIVPTSTGQTNNKLNKQIMKKSHFCALLFAFPFEVLLRLGKLVQ